MKSIADLARWFACGMRLLSSWQTPSTPSGEAMPAKTAAPSGDSASNWRLLTVSSSAPGHRYLVRRTTNTHRFSAYAYDLRTGLTWRCDFANQRERNRYLNQLRRGYTDSWPAAIVIGSTQPVS
jgi:hypothetical protein